MKMSSTAGTGLLFILMVVSASRAWAQPNEGLAVSGTFVFMATSEASSRETEIELPDVGLELILDNDTAVDSDVTKLDGRFLVTAPVPGTYRICWTLGSSSDCSRRFEVAKGPIALGQLRARVKDRYRYGRVLTGDDRPCWIQDAFFELDVSTRVEGGGQIVRANTQGEFALIDLPDEDILVLATCEGASVNQRVQRGTSAPLDMHFDNRAPRITSLAAFDGDGYVWQTMPGASLKIVANDRDPDGDTIEYEWQVLADGVVAGGNTSTTEWKLAAREGRQIAYVMARDGEGGYAFKRLEIEASPPLITISGRALDESTGLAVRNAEVTLGNASTRTSESGWFSLSTKPLESDRHVLNIHHRDYALVSRIHDRSARGNTYPMIRAQVTIQPGDSDIVLEDTRSGGPCGIPEEGGQKRVKRLVSTRIVREETVEIDKNQREIDSAIMQIVKRQRDCSRRGVQLRIPGGSLVTPDGKTFEGMVRSAVTTLNAARRALPGDYQGIDMSGERIEMLSFGAMAVDLTTMSGEQLQLARSALADVRSPISSYQMAASAASIPLWSYDRESGFWREEGKAERVMTSDGPFYSGKVSHFSEINMDIATDPAAATCLKLEISDDFSAWNDLVLRAYLSFGGDSLQVKETAVDASSYHVIYRIPYGTDFPPNTVRLELRGTLDGEERVVLDDIINTDARPKMTGTDLWPPAPYDACGEPYELTLAPGVVPPYGEFDTTGLPSFLVGPFGEFNPADGAAQAADYYAAIDPANVKATLGGWWDENGFGPNGDGIVGGVANESYVNQPYLNHNDLGFGRDMHCLENGDDLACYVTNYGLPDQNPDNADAAANKDPAQRGATVAMEYDASAPADIRVQFYVFGGGVVSSGRISFADLDGLGPKPVPFLCMVCHGGEKSGITDSGGVVGPVRYARFREFDLPSLRYSMGRDWDFGSTNLNEDELDNFARLNRMVRDSTLGTPIADLITRWYGSTIEGAPVQPAVPIGWIGNESSYHEVHAQSCRTCHVSRDEGDPDRFFVFDDVDDFTAFSDATVCGNGSPKRRYMPNAFVTYKNFWVDTSRVLAFESLFGLASDSCNDP